MFKTYKEFIENNNHFQNLLNKLIALSWERYNPEIKDFFDKLSYKDPDIKGIIDELNNSKNNSEPDVISKNASDSNYGNGEL
jgi:hypothetical protein